ncbi:MAG: phosphodiester glycosidase family protein [Candidatus Marinimicrobia bacterium]|nr:phosphodiester glycosidase family protein [Candidatus Neomarinimicrobiota bacterium]
MHKHVFYLLAIVILFTACTKKSETIRLEWSAIDSINQNLPEGINVYHATNAGENIRAWYVKVEESRPEIESRIIVSNDDDARETVSEFALRLHAPVVINGGYFRMDLYPATHVGILKVDDQLIHAATTSVLRGEQRFFLHRAALGIDSAGGLGVEWVSSEGDKVYKWEKPIPNKPGKPGGQLDSTFRELWTARDILGAGPLLIRDGKIKIPINEEVFFGTSIPDVHPRTAAGITKDGSLILLLVDGRQLASRGVNLSELAEILYDLHCVDALNLDGGGSSALVINGLLMNRPAGSSIEREVMSAIAVYAK